MFTLTDEAENSPESTSKAKPAEVNIDLDIDKELKKIQEGKAWLSKDNPKLKAEFPEWKDKKNDNYNEYEYSDDTEEDDTKW